MPFRLTPHSLDAWEFTGKRGREREWTSGTRRTNAERSGNLTLLNDAILEHRSSQSRAFGRRRPQSRCALRRTAAHPRADAHCISMYTPSFGARDLNRQLFDAR